MTLLGKIFTVLIFLASIVCMSVAIMVGASHKHWKDIALENKDKYNALKEARDAARTEFETLRSSIERERVSRAMAVQQLQTKALILSQEAENKEIELQAQTQLAQTRLARMEQAEARLAELDANIADLKSENLQLRQNVHEQIQLVVQLTDTKHQLEGAERRLRERAEQLANDVALMTRIMDANGLDMGSLTAHIPPDVDGKVTAVSDQFDGLLEINIGSDDGLREGHQLDVYRGPNFLGRIIVKQAWNNYAVAEVIEDLTQGPIREDDYVTTKFRG